MDLPLDLFPERGNRDRLRSLFSEQTELSEDSLRFWRRMILAYAKHRGKFHLSPQELEVNFTVEGIVPSSLSSAIMRLMHKELSYHESLQRSFVMNVAMNVVTSLASASFGIQYEFIHLELLQEVETIIVRKCSLLEETDRIFAFTPSTVSSPQQSFLDYLHQLGADIASSDEHIGRLLQRLDHKNYEILIDYMLSKQSIVVTEDRRLLMVGSNSKSITIPEVLISKYELKHSILKLQRIIEEYRRKIDLIDEDLKLNLQKGVDKKRLLGQFKRKKILESAVQKFEESALALLPIETQLLQAEVNVLVVDAYKAGSVGLKTLRNTMGNVENLIDEFAHETELMDEAQVILESSTTKFDEEELQLELEKLTLSSIGEETQESQLESTTTAAKPSTESDSSKRVFRDTSSRELVESVRMPLLS